MVEASRQFEQLAAEERELRSQDSFYRVPAKIVSVRSMGLIAARVGL